MSPTLKYTPPSTSHNSIYLVIGSLCCDLLIPRKDLFDQVYDKMSKIDLIITYIILKFMFLLWISLTGMDIKVDWDCQNVDGKNYKNLSRLLLSKWKLWQYKVVERGISNFLNTLRWLKMDDWIYCSLALIDRLFM